MHEARSAGFELSPGCETRDGARLCVVILSEERSDESKDRYPSYDLSTVAVLRLRSVRFADSLRSG